MPRQRNTRSFPMRDSVRQAARLKTTRRAIEHQVWQAEHIGWPALAASFKQDLAAFDAKHGGLK